MGDLFTVDLTHTDSTMCSRYDDNKWAETVTVHAGRDKVPFQLHTTPLTEKSFFFRTALRPGRWTESNKKLVQLAKINAEYFAMYTYWIYNSQLDYTALGYHPNGDDFVAFPAVLANGEYCPETHSNVSRHMEKTGDWAHRLIVLWVHAGFLGDVRLQNTISEELEKWWFKEDLVVSIHRRTFEFVDQHTPPTSPLRKLCIDWAELSHVFLNRVGSQPEVERLPKWLLSELLLLRMFRERGTLRRDPRMMDLTQWGRYNVC